MQVMRGAVVFFVACLIGGAGTARAQVGTEATITGVVQDASGAVVGGATIVARQLETGFVRSAQSDARGHFEVQALPFGPYALSVEANGFAPWTIDRLELTVGERRRVQPTLTVEQVTQTVTVQADAASLQTDHSAVQTVVQMRQIRELPLATRNPVELVGLVPGMRFLTQNNGPERNAFVQGLGARSQATGFQIDGANANAGMDEGAMGVSNVETIAEFNVQTSSFSAESGRSPIQVNMASKSGTNELHGSLWEFVQHDSLNARNAFATGPKPKFKRHQFGVAVGGPIARDRLFFFGSVQSTPLRNFKVYNDIVPSAAMLSGDFSGLATPLMDPQTGRPFDGNRIPQDRISAASKYFTPRFLQPNSGETSFRATADQQFDLHEYFGRLDYQLSSAQRIFGRWIYTKSDNNVPAYRPDLIENNGTAQHNVAVTYSNTLTPNIVLTVTGGYLKSDNHSEAPGVGLQNDTELSGIQGIGTAGREAFVGPPNVFLNGYQGFTLPFGVPLRLWSSVRNVRASLSMLRTLGRTTHSLSAGYEFNDRTTFANHGSSDPRGTSTFNGQYSGNPVADYLLGLPSFTARNFPLNEFGIRHAPYSGAYVQDNVQLGPRVSVQLGLRYEYWHEKEMVPGNAAIWDPRIGKLVASEDQDGRLDFTHQATAQFLAPASEGLWVTASEAGLPRGLFKANGHWAPRLGITWRPDDRIVVRGGYGLYFNGFTNNRSGSTVNIPYWTLENQTFTSLQPVRWETAWPSDPSFFIAPTIYSPIYDFGATKSAQYNLSVQMATPLKSTLTLSYVGATYTGQAAVLPQNEVPPGSYPNLQAARPFPRFSNIWMVAPAVDARYDALQTKWERRFGDGFTALVSYAWSKHMADSVTFDEGELDAIQPFAPPGYLRGRSRNDRRHLATVSSVYYLPFGRDQRFASQLPLLVDGLIGGWQLSAVWRFQSGAPLRINTPGNTLGNGWGTRANQMGDPHIDNPSADRWFNTDAFAPAPPREWGNSGIGILDGPSFTTLDLGLMKNFSLPREWNLQFRAELFNALNHVNYFEPNTDVGTPGFGRIFGSHPPRTVQLGVRMVF